MITSHGDAISMPDSSGRRAQFPPLAPAAVWRRLPDLPNVSVTPDDKYFLPATLIYPDSELVGDGNVSGWRTEGFPFAPTAIWGDLPFLPNGIIVAYGKDLQSAIGIFTDGMRSDMDV